MTTRVAPARSGRPGSGERRSARCTSPRLPPRTRRADGWPTSIQLAALSRPEHDCPPRRPRRSTVMAVADDGSDSAVPHREDRGCPRSSGMPRSRFRQRRRSETMSNAGLPDGPGTPGRRGEAGADHVGHEQRERRCVEEPDDIRRGGEGDRLGAATRAVHRREARGDEECDRVHPPGQARAAREHRQRGRVAGPQCHRDHQQDGAKNPQSRVDPRSPIPAGDRDGAERAPSLLRELRLMHHRRDRMARCADESRQLR